MRDAVSEPVAAGEAAMPPGAFRGRLRALWERLPGPLRRRLRLPRLTRRRLAVLGVAGLLVVVCGAFVISSTSTYSAYVTFRELNVVGIPSLEGDLDFGEVPRDMAMHRTVQLANDGKLNSYVVIFSWGGIRNFLHVDDAFFNLSPGEQRTVDFDVTAPHNATDGQKQSGRVFVLRLPWYWPF
jgi:hypothetical protein